MSFALILAVLNKTYNVVRQGRGAVCRVPAPKGHTGRTG